VCARVPGLTGTGAGQHGAARGGMYRGCLGGDGAEQEAETGRTLPAAAVRAAGGSARGAR